MDNERFRNEIVDVVRKKRDGIITRISLPRWAADIDCAFAGDDPEVASAIIQPHQVPLRRMPPIFIDKKNPYVH